MENKDTYKTKVVFRKHKNGDVIALFFEEVADYAGLYCLSYEAIGQHGAASTFLVDDTKLATPEEYKALKEELESIGYDLEIYSRMSSNAYNVRKQRLAEYK